MKNINLNQMLYQPVLKEIDLTRGDKSNHPDIKTDGTTYLALYDGNYRTVSFGKQWFGLTSHGSNCGQFNTPGYNSSSWQRLWEIVEESDNVAENNENLEQKTSVENVNNKMKQNIISFAEIEYIYYDNKKIYKTDLLKKYGNILIHSNNYDENNKNEYYYDNNDFMDYYDELIENNDCYYDEENDIYFRDVDKYLVSEDYIVCVNNMDKYIIESALKTYGCYPENFILMDLNGKELKKDKSIQNIKDYIVKIELENINH